jgi:hypothetical protein
VRYLTWWNSRRFNALEKRYRDAWPRLRQERGDDRALWASWARIESYIQGYWVDVDLVAPRKNQRMLDRFSTELDKLLGVEKKPMLSQQTVRSIMFGSFAVLIVLLMQNVSHGAELVGALSVVPAAVGAGASLLLPALAVGLLAGGVYVLYKRGAAPSVNKTQRVPRIQDIQTPGEITASEAILAATRQPDEKAVDHIIQRLEQLLSLTDKKNKTVTAHRIHIPNLEAAAAIAEQVDATQSVLAKEFSDVYVYTAPSHIAKHVQDKLGSGKVVLPSDGDMDAVITEMARRYPGHVYHLIADNLTEEEVRALTQKYAQYAVRFSRIDPSSDPYAWARSLIEYYLGNYRGDLAGMMQFQKVGWNLVVARLVARQA